MSLLIYYNTAGAKSVENTASIMKKIILPRLPAAAGRRILPHFLFRPGGRKAG